MTTHQTLRLGGIGTQRAKSFRVGSCVSIAILKTQELFNLAQHVRVALNKLAGSQVFVSQAKDSSMRRFFLTMFVLPIGLLTLMGNNHVSAGNVTARVIGGQLFVYGDQTDNSISMDSLQPGQIVVTGLPSLSGGSTSINGHANASVTLSGWTGGIYCYMFGGSDSVSFPRGVVRGATHFDLGDGNDELFIGSLPIDPAILGLDSAATISGFVNLQSSLFVLASNGDDFVSLVNAKVKGVANFDLGNGGDELQVGDVLMTGTLVEFLSNCIVYPGSGFDTADFTATHMFQDFVFDDSTSSLSLTLRLVSIDRNAFLYGTTAHDSLELENVTVANLLQIFSEGGDDLVNLGSVQCSTLEVFAGLGVDTVQLDAVTATTLRVFLDAGADMLNVSGGSYQKMYCYGASENDLFKLSSTNASELNLFGDSGTDTLIQSANTIGKTRLYSIENK